MKKKIILAAAVSCGIITVFLMRGGSDLGPKVTKDNIRKIQLGMTSDQVISILGEPLSQSPVLMTYSRPVKIARWYPMLWVHFDKGKVIEVYAKRYIFWEVDDVGVYGLRKEGNSEKPWETIYFEKSFP